MDPCPGSNPGPAPVNTGYGQRSTGIIEHDIQSTVGPDRSYEFPRYKARTPA